MKRASIISIGTELALGQTVDTNSAWLARRLAAVGIRAVRHVTVADEKEDIREALLSAAAGAEVVLVTGGLGPTEDDLTRVALAEAMGVGLEPDAASLEQIRGFFARRGREMPAVNACQAMRPVGARCIENSCGTAPGVRATLRGTPVYVMPGVPSEMREMYERDVEPELVSVGSGGVIESVTMLTHGMGESQIGARIADLMHRGRNPEVGTTAQMGIVGVRINAAAANRETAKKLIEETARELNSRLGAIVFGREGETLAGAVGRLLIETGRTVGTAESCTGGLIAKQITDVAGSSAYFTGGMVTYSNRSKCALLGVDEEIIRSHGAVSGPVAEAMATGALERFGSHYALSVTGIAGPSGGTEEKPVGLVFVGLAEAGKGVESRRFLFGADASREIIRQRAAAAGLDWVRRRMMGVE